ncbi:phosphatase PAP2 family protein [Amnibacterium kyonggiense]
MQDSPHAHDDDHGRGHRFVGGRDVTRWTSPAGRRFARLHTRLAERIGAHRALLLTLGIGGGVAVGASWGAARIYDAVAGADGIADLDRPILHRAMRLRSRGLDLAAGAIAEVFGPVGMPVLAAGSATALAVSRRQLSPATVTVAAGAGSLFMTLAGKDVIHRHRPPHRDAVRPFEHSPSFPSGHTLNATVVSGTLAYLLVLRQRSGRAQTATIAAAAGTAATIGLSRVLLGAHWFTDVVVGWTLGTGWLAVVVTSHRLYLTSRLRQQG